MVRNTEYCFNFTLHINEDFANVWKSSFQMPVIIYLKSESDIFFKAASIKETTKHMCTRQKIFFFNPLPLSSTSLPSPRLLLSLLSPAVYSNTWLLPLQLACWIFHYFLILVLFPSWRVLGKKRNYLESVLEPKKSAILIRSEQSLVKVYINTIQQCVPSEDSIASGPSVPQQLRAGMWKICEEEKK